MEPDISAIYQKRFTEKVQKAEACNDKLNSTLQQLLMVLKEIGEAYFDASNATALICRSSLDNFFKEEDKYRDVLTKFTKTLFAESLGDDHPALKGHGLVLRGMPGDSERHRKLQAECQRLGSVSQASLRKEIAAEVAWDSARAQIEDLRASLLLLKSGADSDAPTALATPIVTEQEHKAIAGRMHALRSHVERIRRSEVPDLLDDLCGSLAAEIELTQLRFQEARHRFFIHRQEKLVGWLMKQRQWNTLLVMLHETEHRNQKILLRVLDRLLKEQQTLLLKTSPPTFHGLADRQRVSQRLPAVYAALKVLSKERLNTTPSEVSEKAISAELQESKEMVAMLGEFRQAVGDLRGLVLPGGPESEPQLSYPEVQQMIGETRSQVKALTQKAAIFTRRAANKTPS